MKFFEKESNNVKTLREFGLDEKYIKKLEDELCFYKKIAKTKKHMKLDVLSQKKYYDYVVNLLDKDSKYHVVVKEVDGTYTCVMCNKSLKETELDDNTIKLNFFTEPIIVNALIYEFAEAVPSIGSKTCLTNFLNEMIVNI